MGLFDKFKKNKKENEENKEIQSLGWNAILQSIHTPNGQVDFVEFIGVTNEELLAVKNKEIDVKTLYQKIGSDITDYNRKSVV